VAARGLDLPDLGLVIHAEAPANRAGLLHRSGRTGRAGRKGVSVLLAPYPRVRRIEQLLGAAGVRAEWSGPPTAEEIWAKDQVRLLADPLLAEPASEEELEQARLLLQNRTAEAAAVAFLRLNRTRLPAPEDLYDAGPQPRREERGDQRPQRERPERRERVDYGGDGDMAWFRLAVGRSANADPKWLIPLICRLGHVTKADIGKIRIFDRETKFEITREAEARFAAAVASAPPEERMRIERAGAPSQRADGPRPQGVHPGKPHRGGKPGKPGNQDKPFRSGKPARGGKPDNKRRAGS
jgi:ATP-dependent RNA helicase DeaD